MASQKTAAQTASDALAIWEGGACNPRGIARALVDAIDAASVGGSDGVKAEQAAPVRVILAHLVFLCGVSLDGIGGCESRHGDVHADLARCRELAEGEAK